MTVILNLTSQRQKERKKKKTTRWSWGRLMTCSLYCWSANQLFRQETSPNSHCDSRGKGKLTWTRQKNVHTLNAAIISFNLHLHFRCLNLHSSSWAKKKKKSHAKTLDAQDNYIFILIKELKWQTKELKDYWYLGDIGTHNGSTHGLTFILL